MIPADRQLSFEELIPPLPSPALAPAEPAPANALCTVTPVMIEGDCIQHMRTMPAKSVAAIVTSPPYNLGKRYSLHDDDMPENHYFAWQGEVANQIARLLRPGGHLFIVLGSNSKRPWRSIDVAKIYGRHLVLQNRITWVKSLAVDASSVPDKTVRDAVHMRTFGHFVSLTSDRFLNPCAEDIWHFSQSGDSPINRLAVGVPYVFADQPARFGHHRNKHCAGNVWHIPTPTVQSNSERFNHPATFPIALADRCLRLAAPGRDGLVLDPFAGIGSTLAAAKALGLSATGIEIDPAYCNAARQQLADMS
jgi:site-specific DNA-methyltransferase (adenine-specific)